MNTREKIAALVLCACVGLLLARAKGCDVAGPGKATAATYFYEKDTHAPPSEIMAGLNTLNRAGVVATTHEVDTTDGTGEVPDQHKVALPAAKEAGLPALVVMAGDKVRAVIKDPTTAAQVTEAAR